MKAKTSTKNAESLLDPLRRHLMLLGLHYTLDQLDAHLSWAQQHKPGSPQRVLQELQRHKVDSRVSGALQSQLMLMERFTS